MCVTISLSANAHFISLKVVNWCPIENKQFINSLTGNVQNRTVHDSQRWQFYVFHNSSVVLDEIV